ncbi:hypothetical protein [Allokutzneria sp. NRRL B-24872]|uniref:hypothetical protein n=1 Tax=Allokutzneria sp. NRRL B-24872 TaxID=1137961 RepID=UPI000A363FD6|nr:hypothetical protein [Allokutzneria sp. NRRL B-24872]
MTEHDRLLGALRPIRAEVEEMSEQAFQSGRERLLTATKSQDQPRVHRLAERTRSRRSPLVAAAAAVVVVVGIGGGAVCLNAGPDVVAPATSSYGEPLPPEMPSQPLNRAGELLAKVTDQSQRPGQYRYVAERTVVRERTPMHPSGYVDHETLTEWWIPANRDDPWSSRRDGGAVEPRDPSSLTSAPSVVPERVVAQLPRDPRRLYAAIAAPFASSRSANQLFFSYAKSLLVANKVPADLRGPLFQALSCVPRIEVHNGGVDVSLTTYFDNSVSETLVINSADGQLLSTSRTFWGRPQTSEDSSYEYGVVGAVGEKPTR